MLVFTLIGVNLLVFILALLWILVPAIYGLPSKPTNLDRIRMALKLVGLKQNEVLYDLGAGDGRVLLIAVQEFGAKAVGIEVGPVQCALIWLRATASGFGNNVQIQWGNFFKSDLSKADVVYVYATSTEVAKLAPYLEKQMKPGSRVVSISADFPEWEPFTFDETDLIFVYAMPPTQGSLTTYMLKNVN
jgi:Mycolic acid cyclopropane synthetase